MKKVLLRFYSANNLGDDLFIKIITSRYINSFSLIAMADSPTLRSIDNLRVYKNRMLSATLYRLGMLLGKNNFWLKLLVSKNDLLVYTGGSIFIEGDDIKKWGNERSFYRDCKKPYYILGSNVGPYSNSQFTDILHPIFNKAEDVCFRDQASYALFKKINTVRVASDIVFSLDISKYKITKNEKLAIISVIDCKDRFGEKIANKYDQEIINLTKNLVGGGYSVVYMSFCKIEGDEFAIDRIVSKLDDGLAAEIDTFRYDGDLDVALTLIARCEIMVATRFHAMILGLLFGKKVIPITYSKKMTNVLNDIKFDGQFIDINGISDFNGNNFNFSRVPIAKIDQQIKLAELQFQKLDKVLVRRK